MCLSVHARSRASVEPAGSPRSHEAHERKLAKTKKQNTTIQTRISGLKYFRLEWDSDIRSHTDEVGVITAAVVVLLVVVMGDGGGANYQVYINKK